MPPITRQIIGLRVAGVLFRLFALLHLLRILSDVHLTIGAWAVPPTISGIVTLICGALGWWFMRLAHPTQKHGCC
jgi:hypothetical protein